LAAYVTDGFYYLFKGQKVSKSKEDLRFGFGKNWRQFLLGLTDEKIDLAQQSLVDMLGVKKLKDARFLDIGSGSGLFSLVARRSGAVVHSFDYDQQSVACTNSLKEHYFENDSSWEIEQGSVLDKEYLRSLGKFEIVYSWGVLHHTGAMWDALSNVVDLVEQNGKLFIAIYNDQGRTSDRWLAIKRVYNRMPDSFRFLILWPTFVVLWGPTMLRDLLRGKPFYSWRHYQSARGMSAWRDVVDWVGGYPFEVARPEEIFDFFHSQGFQLIKMKTCGGGLGCNEFVFKLEK
jgi:2-polyprenyl-6-hydroxyphenyl methylase/3-demethylubiquinone-9 3-methyltransferase